MKVPTIISKETMTAGFPSITQNITGTCRLGNLFRVYRHMIYYTQLQFIDYHTLN